MLRAGRAEGDQFFVLVAICDCACQMGGKSNDIVSQELFEDALRMRRSRLERVSKGGRLQERIDYTLAGFGIDYTGNL